MRQFDIYLNGNPKSRDRFPYLLDIQADLLSDLETRVVIPLGPEDTIGKKQITRLMPRLQLDDGRHYIAFTSQLASIPRRELSTPTGSAAASRADIVAALDLLFTGV